MKTCASHIPFLENEIYQDKGEDKEGELRCLQHEINVREEGIFIVVASRGSQSGVGPRKKIVLTRAGQKILQVGQSDRPWRYFNMTREVVLD